MIKIKLKRCFFEEVETFMKFKMLGSVSYVNEWKMECEQSEKKYKSFYKWMNKCVKRDKKDVIDRELEYLLDTYEKLATIIDQKSYDYNNLIKLRKFSEDNTELFIEILEDMKIEKVFFSETSLKNKDYRHYNRLACWYTNTTETVDDIISNISKKQVNQTKNDYDETFSIGEIKIMSNTRKFF